MKPTQEEFTQWRTPRRGTKNPEIMSNPFWLWCIENPQSAYATNEAFNGESSFGTEPCWSFERFGQSTTTLDDGTTIYLGGEHEDSYDPDFYIYNDVVVVSPKGVTTIYGYPEEVFPPTDFHTATLVDDEIILIGSLGYPDQRDEERTQVCVLDTKDWSIRQQSTSHSPGWISNHEEEYDAARHVIRITGLKKWQEQTDLIDDFSTWELDLTTWQWNCVEVKNWKLYKFCRKDGEPSNIWQIRLNIPSVQVGFNMCAQIEESDDYDEETKEALKEAFTEMEQETAKAIAKSKPELLSSLYHPAIPFCEIPRPVVDWEAEDADEQEDRIEKVHPYNHYRIEIDGVHICFIEDMYEVTMRVEGELDKKTTKALLKSIRKNLSKVEGVKYKVVEV